MSEIESNAYAKGFQIGWDKCRKYLCERFTLDIQEVMACEREDLEGEKDE